MKTKGVAVYAALATLLGCSTHEDVSLFSPRWACLDKVDTNSGGFDVV
jgi:hypothetical protein